MYMSTLHKQHTRTHGADGLYVIHEPVHAHALFYSVRAEVDRFKLEIDDDTLFGYLALACGALDRLNLAALLPRAVHMHQMNQLLIEMLEEHFEQSLNDFSITLVNTPLTTVFFKYIFNCTGLSLMYMSALDSIKFDSDGIVATSTMSAEDVRYAQYFEKEIDPVVFSYASAEHVSLYCAYKGDLMQLLKESLPGTTEAHERRNNAYERLIKSKA